jgi:hypothetical protein
MKQLKHLIIFHHENQLNHSKKMIYLTFFMNNSGHLCYSRWLRYEAQRKMLWLSTALAL